MKVVMLNPPFLPKFSREQRSPAVTKSGTLYYPMWLAYATGVMEQAGFDTKLIDAPARGYNMAEISDGLKHFCPQMVVIDTSTPSIRSDVQIAAEIKNLLPHTTTVLVGPHVSALPEETLKLDPAVDVIARGEYDYTVRDVARILEKKGDFEAVPGIAFRRNGQILSTPARGYIEDLDRIPFVSRVYHRHLEIKDYFYAICRYPEITIITGRGCLHGIPVCLLNPINL